MKIRDPIYGDIEFTDEEEKLINSQAFKRLHDIKQLSFTHHIYPNAVHTRYAHSLGVCEAVTRMFDSIQSKTKFFRDGDRELIRYIALCHDIGHAPFSHAGEALCEVSHEELVGQILEYEKDSIVFKNNYGIESWDLINQTYNGEGNEFFSDPILSVLRSLMDGVIDADKLDYLYRDAYFCGVKYGEFDRDTLINSLTLIRNNGVMHIGIEHWGLQALEGFILARYYMFNQVYHHPLHRLYDKLYVDEMRKNILKDGMLPTDDIKKYLTYNDSKVVNRLKFLKKCEWVLVYDADYDIDIRKAVDSKLGKFLVTDTPRKAVLQSETILVNNSDTGTVYSAYELSPILKGLRGAEIYKLRYYAPVDIADKLRVEIQSIIKEVKK